MELNFRLPPKGFKRLFYDIETSPNIGLFWSASWKANIPHDNIIKERAIICICYKWEGQSKVHSLQWDIDQCDKKLLVEFMDVVERADECVGHNGDNFDEKWVRTRCLKHGISCPPRFGSLDTLKKARSHFRFNSNRLDYIGKFLFGEGKIDTGGFGLWKNILLKDCPKAMKKMVKYCKGDVELLERVYHHLRPYITHNTNAAVHTGGEKYDCPNCGSENTVWRKNRTTTAGTIRAQFQCRDKGCNSYFTVSNKTHMTKLADEMAEKVRNV